MTPPGSWLDRGVRDGLIPRPWSDEYRTERIPAVMLGESARPAAPRDPSWLTWLAPVLVVAAFLAIFGLIFFAAGAQGA